MALNIKLENFEGPLDLLLHLVEKDKFNIHEINISKIIDEYLILMKEAVKNSLEIKTEFLVVATELLEIKSLSVLNKKEKKEKEEQLGQRLLEYKLFKDLSEQIILMENEFSLSFTKDGTEVKKAISTEIDLSSLTIERLFQEYKRIVDESKEIEMKLDLDTKYTLEEGVIEVERVLSENENGCDFATILGENYNRFKVIMVFLTILEMYKAGKIDIVDENAIFIKRKIEEVENVGN